MKKFLNPFVILSLLSVFGNLFSFPPPILIDAKEYLADGSLWDTNKYRSNSYLETVWSDCNKINKTHFYHLGGKEENRNEMLEALILNYQPIDKPEPIPYKEGTEQLKMFIEKNLPLSAYKKV